MIKILKNEDLKEVIKEGNYIVDFYADWCGPCQMMEPILEELEGIDIIKVDIEEFENEAIENGVMSIPTLIFFKDGKEVTRKIGFKSKEDIEEVIKTKL